MNPHAVATVQAMLEGMAHLGLGVVDLGPEEDVDASIPKCVMCEHLRATRTTSQVTPAMELEGV